MKRFYPALGLFIVFAALTGGCGKKKTSSTAAALVGQDTIQILTIVEALEPAQDQFKSAEEELAEKEKLLDLLIGERLLIQQAYRQKIDQDSVIREYEKIQAPLFLIERLYQEEVRDKSRLTDDEVRRLYENLKNERCLKLILHHDKKVAQYLADLLKKGVSVDSLIRIHSEDPSRHRGGEVGCYSWFNPIANHFESVMKLKPGEWVGPVNLERGWGILYCERLQPVEMPPLEIVDLQIRSTFQAERERTRSAQFAREIRTGANFRLVDSALQYANRRQKELSETKSPSGQLTYASHIRTENLKPAEREMPLALFEGGKITLNQYLERLQGRIPASRYLLDTTETTKAILFQFIFQDLMVKAAQKRGLDKNPDYRRRLRQAVEGNMALAVKNRIWQEVKLDPSAPGIYFKNHPEEFVQPVAFNLYEINLPSAKDLENLKPRLKNKAEFIDAAMQTTAREQLRPSGGLLGWVEQFQFPELFAAASKLKKGQTGGPVRLVDGSYSLIYVDDRRKERKQTFAEVRAQLQQNIFTHVQDSAFAAWVAAQKTETKITIFAEALRKTVDYERYARMKEEEAKKTGGKS